MTVAAASPPGGFVAAALKHVPVRTRVDPLTGTAATEAWGVSDADLAALEWALRLGDRWSLPVVAVTGGRPGADAILRDAAAAGASRLRRVDLAEGASSHAVASALAPVLAGAAVVCCGDASLDRGSGSVPAFLAHELGAGQALGVIALESAERGTLLATRRLDRGRRELLRVAAPAVVSVEAAGVRLRRATLSAVLTARDAAVEVLTASVDETPANDRVRVVRRGPYRPRARMLPAPAGPDARARVLSLTGALAERTRPRTLTVDPEAGADELIAYLREAGYAP